MGSNGTRCVFHEADHSYWLEPEHRRIPGVNNTLEMGGLTDDYSRVPAHIRQRAMLQGKYVHEATVHYDKAMAAGASKQDIVHWLEGVNEQEEPFVDPILRPFLRAWMAFHQREPFVAEGMESLAWQASPGVAGTLDRYGLWNGEPCVVDIKTGSKINWTVRYQLVAYAWLQYGEQFSRVRLQVVHLKPDGSYECPPPTYDRDGELRADFLAALRIVHCRLRQGHKLPESLT